MNPLLSNDWTITIVGGLIVSGVSGLAYYMWNKKKVDAKPHLQLTNSSHTSISANTIGRDLIVNNNIPNMDESIVSQSGQSPADIATSLSKVSAYQQKEISKTYLGLRVKWVVFFKGMGPDHSNQEKGVYIITGSSLNSLSDNVTVSFYANVSQYPQLKFIKRNEKLTVSGVISSIETVLLSIFLDEVEIT